MIDIALAVIVGGAVALALAVISRRWSAGSSDASDDYRRSTRCTPMAVFSDEGQEFVVWRPACWRKCRESFTMRVHRSPEIVGRARSIRIFPQELRRAYITVTARRFSSASLSGYANTKSWATD